MVHQNGNGGIQGELMKMIKDPCSADSVKGLLKICKELKSSNHRGFGKALSFFVHRNALRSDQGLGLFTVRNHSTDGIQGGTMLLVCKLRSLIENFIALFSCQPSKNACSTNQRFSSRSKIRNWAGAFVGFVSEG